MAGEVLYQRGGGNFKPLRYTFCKSCGFKLPVTEFVTETNEFSPHYQLKVCVDCFDGPRPQPPRIEPEAITNTEPDEIWQ